MSAGCGPAQRLLPFYLNGSLEGEEGEAVRLHLETCDACRREMGMLLPLARAIEEQGAAVQAASGPLATSEVSPPNSRAAGAAGAKRAAWLAAAAAALVAAGLWVVLRLGGAPPDRAAGPEVLDLGNGQMRGEGPLPVLPARPGERGVTLVCLVPVSPNARYAADLLDAGGQVLAHAEDLGPPDSLGRISWTVPRGPLRAAGEYELAISRTDETGVRRDFRYGFRIEAPAGDDPTSR